MEVLNSKFKTTFVHIDSLTQEARIWSWLTHLAFMTKSRNPTYWKSYIINYCYRKLHFSFALVFLIFICNRWSGRNLTLTGIIYLVNISHNRFHGKPEKNLDQYNELFGENVPRVIVFVTTMWGFCPKDEADHEKALREKHLKGMISEGASMERFFHNTKEEAQKIVGRFHAVGALDLPNK